jgi:hypothetical protein
MVSGMRWDLDPSDRAGELTDWKTHKPTAYLAPMDQILPPELNDLEFEALRQLAAHPATCRIPAGIESRLKDIGYAKEVLGGIVLTSDGLQRISQGK